MKKIITLPAQNELVSYKTDKNVSSRNQIMAYLSLPMMLFATVLLTTPTILVQGMDLSISTAVLMTAASEVIVLAFVLWYVGAMDIWTSRLRIRNFKFSTFLIGIGFGSVLFIGLQVFSTLITNYFPNGDVESSDTSVSMAQLQGLEKWLLLIGFVTILGPLLEEIFFRGFVMGFLFDSMKVKKTGAIVGIIVSSVFFSFAHFQGLNGVSDYFHMLWILVVAVVNSLLVLRFDSIWPAFGSHMAYNGITAGFMLAGYGG